MITLVMMKTTIGDVIGMVEIVVETMWIQDFAQNVLALIQITKNVNKNHLFNCNDILGI